MDFGGVFDAISEFFARERLPFAVVGAVGLHAYGLARATSDLDFVAPSEARSRLVPFLEKQGYETLFESSGYSNHLHSDPEFGRVDFVYVSGETSRLLFEKTTTVPFLGREIRVPRPEHLAAMKVQAMKNDPQRSLQEMADIRFLLTLPGVDREEIRGYFEEAGLLDRYDEIQRFL